MKSKISLIAVSVVAILLSLDCSHPTQTTGNGSGTGNAVSAMLYNPGGSPAAHAKVKFYPINYNPRTGLTKVLAVVDSTTTDAQGNYTAKLDTGTYNVLAVGDSGFAYQNSITVIKDSTVHPPADTLKAPGSVRGVIRLQPGDDARTVFILFLGTSTWITPDDSTGRFGVANIAEGTYRVRILTTLDAYVPKDTVLSVTAGKADTLTHDIVLQYTGIPVVSGLKIGYDTLKQIVTLTWSKADTALVKSYNVYRRNVDSNTLLARINTSPVADTVYRDSTGIQDQTYEYIVAAVNKNATEGTKSAALIVKALGMFSLMRTWGSLGSGQGQMNGPVAIAVDSNALIYIADEGNNRIQVFDSTGHYKGEFGNSFLNAPCDIAVQDSFLFVATNGDKKIHKLSLTGDTLAKFALPANASFPHLAIDSSGNIYTIPSATYGKIQVYGSSGLITEYPTTGDYLWGIRRIGDQIFCFNARDSLMQVYSLAGITQPQIVLGQGIYPTAIVAIGDTIIVLNGGKYIGGVGVKGIEVLVYSSKFQYLGRWGGNVPYTQVSDIASDNFGNVYILDSDSRQIRQFRRTK